MTTKIRYLPDQTDPARLYKLVAGLVVPRPIALVSTVDRDGRANLAPFSWFNAVSTDPPYLCVSIGRHAGDRPKDTLNNILATGEFVVNRVGAQGRAARRGAAGRPGLLPAGGCLQPGTRFVQSLRAAAMTAPGIPEAPCR